MPMTFAEPAAKIDEGDRERLVLDATGDASYPTGGYDLTPGLLPFRCQNQIDSCEGTVESTGRYVVFDRGNAKLKWFEPVGTEIPNATDLSADVARLTVLGR